MTPPAAIGSLDPLEAAAHANLHKAIVAHGEWKPQFALGLDAMARIVAMYCRVVRSVHATGLPVPPLMAEDLEEMRGRVRTVMHAWFWTEPDSPEPPLRPDGLDSDAARLCGLPEFGRGNA
jgi:hypothetical protein